MIVDGSPPDETLSDPRRWIIPVEGIATSNGERAGPGECLIIEPDCCSNTVAHLPKAPLTETVREDGYSFTSRLVIAR